MKYEVRLQNSAFPDLQAHQMVFIWITVTPSDLPEKLSQGVSAFPSSEGYVQNAIFGFNVAVKKGTLRNSKLELLRNHSGII